MIAFLKGFQTVLTLVFGFIGGVLLSTGMHYAGLEAWGWIPLFFVLGFIAATIPLNLWVKKRLETVFKGVQSRIEASQEMIRRKATAMQNKMMSSTKGLQKQLEKQQEEAIREAIAQLEDALPLKKWNFLVPKQVDTLRAQLYFQIKEFDKADQCFAKALSLDPVTLAMRLVRLYKRGESAELEKLFAKGLKRFKGEKGAILYALKSWILVKENRIDEAIALLDKGKRETENTVLAKNWEHLVNGRTRNFSNAGIGDIWYALYLETPKPVKVRQQRNARF